MYIAELQFYIYWFYDYNFWKNAADTKCTVIPMMYNSSLLLKSRVEVYTIGYMPTVAFLVNYQLILICMETRLAVHSLHLAFYVLSWFGGLLSVEMGLHCSISLLYKSCQKCNFLHLPRKIRPRSIVKFTFFIVKWGFFHCGVGLFSLWCGASFCSIWINMF